jgi:hypothetical protein
MTTRLQPHGVARPKVATRERQTPNTTKGGLGSPGVCSGDATLQIWIFDDSGSVTGVGGTDPVAQRYREARTALRHVARACSCGVERVGILHFDANKGRVRPTRIGGLGELWLQRGLQVPIGAQGTSDLLAALQIAEDWTDQAKDGTSVQLVVFSDFALTDDDPDDVIRRMESFSGEVTACVLGPGIWPGADSQVQVRHVASTDRRGSFARAVFGELTRRRHGAGVRRM